MNKFSVWGMQIVLQFLLVLYLIYQENACHIWNTKAVVYDNPVENRGLLNSARQKLMGHWYSEKEVSTKGLPMTSTVLSLICICWTEPYPYRKVFISVRNRLAGYKYNYNSSYS